MSRAVVLLALLLASASFASADTPDDRPRPTTVRYPAGLDLAVLVSAIPVISVSGDSAPYVIALYGVAYLAVGPTVHGAHGNKRAIVGSLTRRLLLTAAGGGLLGLAFCFDEKQMSSCHGEDAIVGIVAVGVGIGIGAAIASIIDWTKAHVEVAPKHRAVTPTVAAQRDGVVVGLGGSF